jgi:hypothetical protein
MAMDKYPDRRYASAEALSQDLNRFLHDLPVQARKQILTYRGHKFVKRNRAIVAVIAGGLLLAIIASITTVRNSPASGVQAKSHAKLSGLALAATAFVQSTFGHCALIPPGLVGWWPGEGNGFEIIQSTPFATNHGYATGMVGQAFSFDGKSRPIPPVQPPVARTALELTRFTLEGWIRPDGGSNGTNRFIISKGWHNGLVSGSQFGTNYELFLTGTNAVVLDFYDYPAGPHHPAGYNLACAEGQWCHVAGTYDGSALKDYVNGQLSGRISYAGNPSTSYSMGQPQTFQIGQRLPNPESLYPFKGLIDEVSIYNRALTDYEVSSIYNAGPKGKCKP